MQVDLGGVDADVTEPEGDDAGVDAGVQKAASRWLSVLDLRKRLLFWTFLGVRHVRHEGVCGRSCGVGMAGRHYWRFWGFDDPSQAFSCGA